MLLFAVYLTARAFEMWNMAASAMLAAGVIVVMVVQMAFFLLRRGYAGEAEEVVQSDVRVVRIVVPVADKIALVIVEQEGTRREV
jgi:hypothetical protein